MPEEIKQKLIEEEMKESYLKYSMSVIVSRALPDIRDGLKPVHRRILFAMKQSNLFHDKPFKKSAHIVGKVIAETHPHGDIAVYDSMVRMAQDFSLRYTLIDGQGNWGSIDGDSAAAYRYTEARLSKISEEMLLDVEKETVDFVPNFDGSMKEPLVLPSKIPNLLLNGSSGIAVGMATNIPPHNIIEVVDGIIALIENSNINILDLMQIIKGPDFPTAGVICGTHGVKEAYKTGRGKIIVRAKADVEEKRIIITEIPYQVNKSLLIENIADLVREKKVEGISNIRDESSREGMRIVVDIKQGHNSEVVLNQLYKHSSLQTTFGVIMLALKDNVPKVFNLKELIETFVGHRKEVVTRRIRFELRKAEERAHVLEGLRIALDNIDDVVKLVKRSKNAEEARNGLINNYKLSKEQSQAILDMKLQRLTSLDQDNLNKEYDGLIVYIGELRDILNTEKRIYDIIKDELKELKDRYGDDRRTLIKEEYKGLDEEKLVKEEDVVVTLTHQGYVKRTSLDLYKQQKRGGKGVVSAVTKESDFVERMFIVNTRDTLLFFTNNGRVHWLSAYNVPEGTRYSKGSNAVNILNLKKGEYVNTIIPIKNFEGYLFMATKKGIVKKTNLNEFSVPRKGGVMAINLKEGDRLVNIVLTDGNQDILMATRNGLAVRFNEGDVSVIGRSGIGVRGIRLRKDDYVVGMEVCDGEYVLTITEDGYGKRTKLDEYNIIRRGGRGVRNLNVEKGGLVAGVKLVYDKDEVMFISKKGIMIRVNVSNVSIVGRNAKGVRLIRLNEGDKVVSLIKVAKGENKDFTLGGY